MTNEWNRLDFSRESGYTLIQVAIALTVVGVLITPLIMSYNLYQREQRTVLTTERVQGAIASLQNFRDMNGFYPCPAPLKTPRGTAGYGAATACRTDSTITSLSAGQCDTSRGICIENSIRTTLPDGSPMPDRRVVVGAIPFRTMQLDEEEAFDSYGSRLVYAITESMTNDQLVDDNIGAISVRKADGTALLSPDGSAAFFVFSPGPTKMGAYSVEGALSRACNDTVVAESDEENCNTGFETGTSSSSDSIYTSDTASTAPGTTFFDDQTGYFSNIFNALWRRTSSDQETIEDLSPKDIGIGTTMNPGVRLDISPVGSETETLWARPVNGVNSAFHTDMICDPSGANCFHTSALGGDTAAGTGGMSCPNSGEYILGISNGGPICGPIAIRCPPATPVLQKVNPSGNIQCVDVPEPGCPAATFTACTSNDVSLPASSDGATVTRSGLTNPSAGGCREVTYECNAGTWSKIDDTGSSKCSFTPGPPEVDPPLDCDPGRGPGPYWWTGVELCTGGWNWTNNYDTQCLCQETTVIETSNCQAEKSAYYSPDQVLTRVRTYHADCTDSAPPYNTSACLCNPPSPTTRVISSGSCPSGYTGNVSNQTQVFDTTACKWKNSGTPTNSCTCDLSPLLTYTDPTCDATCEHVASENIFSQAKDPGTCTYSGPVTQIQVGTCSANSFSWQYADSSTGSATSHDVLLGDSCTCSQHQSGVKKICRQSNGALARCLCN